METETQTIEHNPRDSRQVLAVLEKYFGVKVVTFRFISSNGALKEHNMVISAVENDVFEDGVQLPDGTSIFPDRNSAWMNPFDTQPSLAFICYSSKDHAGALGGFQSTQFLSPAAGSSGSGSFQFGSNGNLGTPRLFLASPAVQDHWSMNQPFGGDTSIRMTPTSPIASAPKGAMPTILAIPGPIKVGDNTTQRKRRERDDEGKEVSVSVPQQHKGKKVGTSCHQCKNARAQHKLAYCSMLFVKRTGGDKRICRKKYCLTCLNKFYNESLESSRTGNWICPSCRGTCTCASCVRKQRTRNQNAPQVPSPVALQVHPSKKRKQMDKSIQPSDLPLISSNQPQNLASIVPPEVPPVPRFAGNKQASAEDDFLKSMHSGM